MGVATPVGCKGNEDAKDEWGNGVLCIEDDGPDGGGRDSDDRESEAVNKQRRQSACYTTWVLFVQVSGKTCCFRRTDETSGSAKTYRK